MRQVRDSRLETREARKRLPVNQHNEPLWKVIHPGLFIGYYKGGRGGVWYMRRRIEKDGKKVYEKTRLGIADDYADANDEPEDGFALSLIVPITSRFQPTGPMTSALFIFDFGFWILD